MLRILDMVYRGHVENGVVVLDNSARLPEGTRVSVEPVEDVARSKMPGQGRVWKGVYRHSGPVPTDEDIAGMRREVWPH